MIPPVSKSTCKNLKQILIELFVDIIYDDKKTPGWIARITFQHGT